MNEQLPPENPWTAIIPIRSFTNGKTRLRLTGVDTASVTQAFADDLMGACKQCPDISRTVVVSPDAAVLSAALAHGCVPVREESARGIDTAIEGARTQVTGPVVAILGDTPCVTPAVLSMVIDEARKHPVSFVSDASGVGSTMWFTQPDSSERSHFGHHSRAEHRAHGAVELGAGEWSPQWARARRDVDTDVDLWDALRLGLGAATSRVVDGRQ